jgi:hypothetical protein
MTLGTAVTISGAAASPNAGYHSSPIVTFLMTLFNARLGVWLGNPGPAGASTYHRSAPRFSVRPIVSELFGLTSDRSPYVYLSDGGHFDNLGLYEMVLRRCRIIVVSDASCDHAGSFEDLGNAIRKIRIDLGIPIEFPSGLEIYSREEKDKRAEGRYWAIGRIRYSCVDRDPGLEPNQAPMDPEFDGMLIYIKPAFYGLTEPRDVYNYGIANERFPHESTSDQFYSESQLESYRALGSYIIGRICSDTSLSDLVADEEPKTRDLDWFAFHVRGRETARRAPAGASPGQNGG